MGLSVETGIPVITVFIQGLLSFFSPCVLEPRRWTKMETYITLVKR